MSLECSCASFCIVAQLARASTVASSSTIAMMAGLSSGTAMEREPSALTSDLGRPLHRWRWSRLVPAYPLFPLPDCRQHIKTTELRSLHHGRYSMSCALVLCSCVLEA